MLWITRCFYSVAFILFILRCVLCEVIELQFALAETRQTNIGIELFREFESV